MSMASERHSIECAPGVSDGQRAILSRLVRRARRFCRRLQGDAATMEPGSTLNDSLDVYHGLHEMEGMTGGDLDQDERLRGLWVPLDAKRIALPAEGVTVG